MAHSAIRFSVGRFTTQTEVEKAIFEINSAVSFLKSKRKERVRQTFY